MIHFSSSQLAFFGISADLQNIGPKAETPATQEELETALQLIDDEVDKLDKKLYSSAPSYKARMAAIREKALIMAGRLRQEVNHFSSGANLRLLAQQFVAEIRACEEIDLSASAFVQQKLALIDNQISALTISPHPIPLFRFPTQGRFQEQAEEKDENGSKIEKMLEDARSSFIDLGIKRAGKRKKAINEKIKGTKEKVDPSLEESDNPYRDTTVSVVVKVAIAETLSKVLKKRIPGYGIAMKGLDILEEEAEPLKQKLQQFMDEHPFEQYPQIPFSFNEEQANLHDAARGLQAVLEVARLSAKAIKYVEGQVISHVTSILDDFGVTDANIEQVVKSTLEAMYASSKKGEGFPVIP